MSHFLQVMGSLSEEQYKSGSCFQANSQEFVATLNHPGNLLSYVEQEIRYVEHGICPVAEFTSP